MTDAIPKLSIRHHLWRKGELSWKLDSLQNHIKDTLYELEDATPVCVLSSRQIGKSFGALVYANEFCIKNPGVKVRFLSSTKTQVQDIVSDNMGPIMADAPPDLVKAMPSKLRWLFANGSQIRLGAMERQYVEGNRGGHSHLVIYEEGGFIPSEDYEYAIKSVIGPQLTRARRLTGRPGREIHISTPSLEELHYLHTEILPQAEEIGTAFRYRLDDSPSITPEMRAECVKRCGGEDTEDFEREYNAKIIRSEGLMVVPDFKEAEHTAIFDLPEHYNPLIAIDGGGVKDKTAGLILVFDFARDTLLVWDEFLLDPNTASEIMVKEGRRLETGINWYGKDPSRVADVPGQLQVDLINDHSYMVRLPLKDDLDAAIKAVRTGFRTGKILVHKRCKNLIGNLNTGRYNDKRTDFLRTKAYGHCDPIMALVYGNRMADRHTNPYPAQVIHRDYEMAQPWKKKEQHALAGVASALAPYNPMARRKR